MGYIYEKEKENGNYNNVLAQNRQIIITYIRLQTI